MDSPTMVAKGERLPFDCLPWAVPARLRRSRLTGPIPAYEGKRPGSGKEAAPMERRV
jgi:hypothetical protein